MLILNRYSRLYAAFVRNCIMRAMEYRAQFLTNIVVYNIWTASSLLVITVVFQQVGAVRDWNRWEMYVLYGTYVIIENLCYGMLGPNMWRFNTYVREGTLDLVLTKPVNSQFFASTRYIDMNAMANIPVGTALLIFGLVRCGTTPSPLALLSWLLALGCGFLVAYSIWFMIVTLTIWIVKLQAAGAAFEPVFQIARFPITIYPRRFQALLTFALPVACLTTIPAGLLLGKRGGEWLAFTMLAAAIALTISNRFWNFALRHYGSASS